MRKLIAWAFMYSLWQASGHPVLGVAVARRAANQLQADAGIATTSVAALLADLENDRAPLPRGVVLSDGSGDQRAGPSSTPPATGKPLPRDASSD